MENLTEIFLNGLKKADTDAACVENEVGRADLDGHTAQVVSVQNDSERLIKNLVEDTKTFAQISESVGRFDELLKAHEELRKVHEITKKFAVEKWIVAEAGVPLLLKFFGESELLDEKIKAGATASVLKIFHPTRHYDFVRGVIKKNYSAILPPIENAILENQRYLKEQYEIYKNAMFKVYKQYPKKYIRYMLIVALADCMVEVALFGQKIFDAFSSAVCDFIEEIIRHSKPSEIKM